MSYEELIDDAISINKIPEGGHKATASKHSKCCFPPKNSYMVKS